MGVSFIRKTMPGPTSGSTVSAEQAATLARSMGQRLFENVLREAEQGEQGTGQPASEEMSLMQAPTQGRGLERVRTEFQNADPSSLQAMITAAYIKASALGSGSPTWKDLGSAGIRFSRAGVSSLGTQDISTLQEGPATQKSPPSSGHDDLGFLSARFESGKAGVEAIGYDPGGGTSYGIYQIASKPGTMARFLDFLEDHEPQWAKRLRAAGPADTGSTQGRMPQVWKAIAKENPQRFAALQQAFIRETHYEPARLAIVEATGIDVNRASRAVQEVLWSTAVQHGPGRAADMFIRALGRQGGREGSVNEAALIQSVYGDRGRMGRAFWGSLREALLGRFQEEKAIALAMLKDAGKDNVA
ncbi:MAG: hypothetical protein WHS46_01550 [Desulfosoma sp.]